ncbi:RNA polymerase sigma factor [Nonomuraea rubra]|uniref:RNA polymerase sigma factor n=1 Tax=Nonomuraea rubra TaxID=46180 RepID=UPI0033CAD200
MSQSLTDQRHRAELIAELYDLHAAGLFAYCADQLGDLGSASDVLVAVLSSVPATAPPRAALYAFARREIHRRDIVYSPPAVDPLIDPATALVERSLRELRPHQREVLVLCAVCGLSKAELAWVLDVAPDTAEELAVGAGHRLRQSLGTALASTGVRVPKPVADVYGALGVAPLRDVLGRLPWPQPPGALRIHFAGSRTAAPAPLFVKPRWPSPPMWPQPLADADPATSTVIFPAELLTPPSAAQTPVHEATTAPMPKLRDPFSPPRDVLDPGPPLRDPLGSARTLRDPLGEPRPRSPSAGDRLVSGDQREGERRDGERRDSVPYAGDRWVAGPSSGASARERPFFMAAPDPTAAEPFATGDVILPKDAPDPYMTGDVLVHGDPSLPLPPPRRTPAEERRRQPLEPQPTPEEFRRPPSAREGFRRSPSTPEEFRRSPSAPEEFRAPPPAPRRQASRTEEPVRGPAAPLFKPRAKPRPKPAAEPVYRLPDTREDEQDQAGSLGRPLEKPLEKPLERPLDRPRERPLDRPLDRPLEKPLSRPRQSADPREQGRPAGSSLLDPRPVRARPAPKRRPESGRPPKKVRRRKDRHHDWVWELVGFLLCVAIAMIVFFSMPVFVDP